MARTAPRIYCFRCRAVVPAKRMTWDTMHLAISDDLSMGPFKEDGVDYFRRLRVCTRCEMELPTVEVGEEHLRELLRLRQEVAALREQQAEAAQYAGALLEALKGTNAK